jgi:hypothetical protein
LAAALDVVAAHGAADGGDVLGAAPGGAEPIVAALDAGAGALEDAVGVAAARAAKLDCSYASEGRIVQVVAGLDSACGALATAARVGMGAAFVAMAAGSVHAWIAAVSAPSAAFFSTMLSEPALASVARAHADAGTLWCAALDQSGLDCFASASELAAGAYPATAYACAGAASGPAFSAALE